MAEIEIRRGLNITKLKSDVVRITLVSVEQGTQVPVYENGERVDSRILKSNQLHSIFLTIDLRDPRMEFERTVQTLQPKCTKIEHVKPSDGYWNLVFHNFDDDAILLDPRKNGLEFFCSGKVRLFIDSIDNYRM